MRRLPGHVYFSNGLTLFQSLRVLAIAAGLMMSSQLARGQSDVMRVTAYPPDVTFKALMGDHAWRIFATGTTDSDAAKRLEALIQTKKIPLGSILYLHR
jgi:hypothetical protein